jgi:hypothetical protein
VRAEVGAALGHDGAGEGFRRSAGREAVAAEDAEGVGVSAAAAATL